MVEPKGDNAYQQITGDDSDEDRGRWDELYGTKNYVFGTEPSAFLKRYVHLLPVGRALDIGMGEGRNAVFLARLGFDVAGLDISSMALAKARKLAQERGVRITTIQADLSQYDLPENVYDVVININFLDRALIPKIKKSVKPGGYVVYENPTIDQLKFATGSELRRDQLLEKGELRRLFADWESIRLEEKIEGRKAYAGVIARKPVRFQNK